MKEQNIFEELGVRDPQEMLLKAKIAFRIMEEIRVRGLTQVQAAKLMGIPQPTVSDILRGQFRGMSIERLMGYLRTLDPDFRVVLQPGNKNRPASAAKTKKAERTKKAVAARPQAARGAVTTPRTSVRRRAAPCRKAAARGKTILP